MNNAEAANVIRALEIEDVTYVWLVDPSPPQATQEREQEDEPLSYRRNGIPGTRARTRPDNCSGCPGSKFA
jgi:hypothetical protein